jgi:chemotaxis protein MotB
MANPNQTIIIKKIKKGGHGHHGGAWKVAYADFVTAMMAFFLLLWLLNATEAENLAGLADYFAPTVGVKGEMGIGFRGGKSALSDGIGADKNTNKGIVFGGIPSGPITKVTEEIKEATNETDVEEMKILIDQSKKNEGTENSNDAKMEQDDGTFKDVAKAMEEVVQDLIKNKRWQEGSVEIKRTPDGLEVIIKDLNNDSMFEENSAELKDKMKDALTELSKILRNIPNNIALTGHTSSVPVLGLGANYGNWELSADRANSTRRFLEKNGVQKEQFAKVIGKADNSPIDRRKPEAALNNRISILLMKDAEIPNHKLSTPDSLYIDTNSKDTQKFIEDTDKTKLKIDKAPVKLEENKEIKRIINDANIPPKQ